MSPQPSYPATPWTTLSCAMVGWWLINSILANIGHKNSSRILNLFMKNINKNMIYLSYKIFVILKIKVALIDQRRHQRLP